MTPDDLDRLNTSAAFLRERLPDWGGRGRAPTGLVLGSGLGALADEIGGPDAVRIPYAEIPHFPVSTAPGHRGLLVAGQLDGHPVLALQGRFHYYEGYSMAEVVYPVRVMKLLGVADLVLTNAAGGIDESFAPGDLMLIRDHLKLFTDGPLRGPNLGGFGPRFNDLSDAYPKALRARIRDAAAAAGIPLREGVYAFMPGPQFETPAEIRMLRTLGADAVGMSTVPEAITAAHAGIRVAAVSCISNLAAGILDQPLTEEEVIETTGRVKEAFAKLVGVMLDEVSGEGAR